MGTSRVHLLFGPSSAPSLNSGPSWTPQSGIGNVLYPEGVRTGSGPAGKDDVGVRLLRPKILTGLQVKGRYRLVYPYRFPSEKSTLFGPDLQEGFFTLHS